MESKSDIKFMEKPEWVTWEEICECIKKANIVNDKKGLHMKFADISAEELKKKIQNGKCFIALHNNSVVGMDSFRIQNLRKWYLRGKVVYHLFSAILPEYRGTDVYFGLCEMKNEKVKETGVRVHLFNTAEQNKSVIKINEKFGFKPVVFRPTEGGNYYSVNMLKWDDGCPFPDWFLNFMYNLSKFVSKTFFTASYKFKFWYT